MCVLAIACLIKVHAHRCSSKVSVLASERGGLYGRSFGVIISAKVIQERIRLQHLVHHWRRASSADEEGRLPPTENRHSVRDATHGVVTHTTCSKFDEMGRIPLLMARTACNVEDKLSAAFTVSAPKSNAENEVTSECEGSHHNCCKAHFPGQTRAHSRRLLGIVTVGAQGLAGLRQPDTCC